ncbi:aromatic acid exporter family protein [Streptomyces sp. NPDC101733]|uniref:FUSC family protein n=1 Tax=unclassified Streptomyces TaxID=2593676 RepID=UPI00380E6660
MRPDRRAASVASASVDRLRAHAVAGFGDGVMILKTVLAAALSWWVAADLLALPQPVLAPVGAILVAQATPYATALKSLQRAAGVVVGVLLGAGSAALLGAGLPTIVAVTLVGMYTGRLLRLGSQMHQIAMTAVLVVGSSEHLGYGTARIVDNILGILVGTAVALLVPSAGFTRRARSETARLTRDMAELLDTMGQGLAGGRWAAESGAWVRRARILSTRLDLVRDAVRQAHEAARWHTRSRSGAQAVAQLAEASTALEHVSHQLRGIARGLYNLTFREGRPPALDREQGEPAPRREPAAIPEGLDLLLTRIAATVREVADHHIGAERAEEADRIRLRRLLGEAETDFLSAALAQSPAYGQWRVLCTAAILEDVRKLLYELDPELGPHRNAFG